MGNARNDAPKTATDSQYRALAEFRYHIRRYLHFSDDAAKAAGLEPKQYQLMLAVKGMPDDVTPTVSALSQQLGTRHHSTVELVNRAERNGLVKRFRDGTYVHVELTKKGEKILARAVDQRLQELRVAGPALVKALQELVKSESANSGTRK
jgi:DNA-binding MarR family transcriptional regulator